MGVGVELGRSAHAVLSFGLLGTGRRGGHAPALGTGAAGRPLGASDATAAMASGALGRQGRAAAAPAQPPGGVGAGAGPGGRAHAILTFGVDGSSRRGGHAPVLGTGAAGRPPGASDATAVMASGAPGGLGRAGAGPAPGAAAAAGPRSAPCGAARFSSAAPGSARQAAGPRGSQGIAIEKAYSLNGYVASVLARRHEQQGGSRAPVSSGVKPEGCGARHGTPPHAHGAAQQQPMAAPAPEPAAAFPHALRSEWPESADGEEEAEGAWPPAASSAAAAAARGPVLPYGSQGRRLMARLGLGAQGSGPRAGAPSGLPAEASPLCPPYQPCAAMSRGAGAAARRQTGQPASSQPAAAGPGGAAGPASTAAGAAAPRTLTALRQAAPHAGVARGASGPPSARGAAAAGAAPAAARSGYAGGANASAAAAGAAAGAGAAGQPAARARSAGAAAAAPGGSAGGRAAGGRAAERGGGAGEGRRGPAWPCMVCGALPQAVPWTARCGHSACRACWRRHLVAAQACPACGRETHLRHLAQNYFAGT